MHFGFSFQRAYWTGYGEDNSWCPGGLPDPEIVRMVEARKALGEVSALKMTLVTREQFI